MERIMQPDFEHFAERLVPRCPKALSMLMQRDPITPMKPYQMQEPVRSGNQDQLGLSAAVAPPDGSLCRLSLDPPEWQSASIASL
jgi:hypothetical protein